MIYKDDEMEMKYKGLTMDPFYGNWENWYCLEYFRDKGRALLPSAGVQFHSHKDNLLSTATSYPNKTINPSHELISSY